MTLVNASFRTSLATPDEVSSETDWTLALASRNGGDGVQLHDYVVRRFGRKIPKQYCCMLGRRSMIEHTLDRLAEITPASRTLCVTASHHAEWAMPQLAGRADHVFRQPAARDTGIALYVALSMIRRWAPNATVTITPTDHYVAPATRYLEHVAAAQGVARRMRDKVVILAVPALTPAPDLGYLLLGNAVTEIPEVRQVTNFVEKPCTPIAEDLLAQDALWNTMVMCGTVDALWELGRVADPHLLDILDSLVPLIGTPDEDDALEYIYRAYLPVSFSRDILERAPERLCALELRDVEWSNWGNPERIEAVLALRRSHALMPCADTRISGWHHT